MNFGMWLGIGICAFVLVCGLATFFFDGILSRSPSRWLSDDIEGGLVIFATAVGLLVGLIVFAIGLAVHLWT